MLSGRPTSIVVGMPTQLHHRMAFAVLRASASSIAGVTRVERRAGGTTRPSIGNSQYPLISGGAPACAMSDAPPARMAATGRRTATTFVTLLHLCRRHDGLTLQGIARITPRLQGIAVLGKPLEEVLIDMGANVELRIGPCVRDHELFAVGRQLEALGQACFRAAISTSRHVADRETGRFDDQRLALITTGRVAVQARRDPRQVWVRTTVHV